MVEYILGNYLVATGKITKDQLKDTLQKQDSVRVKLGLIAVAEGMMTLDQANEVNHLQAIIDQRFGDIAVNKGYLTLEQLGKLLKTQGNTYLSFIQTLIDNCYISLNEVDNIISDFRGVNGYSNSEIEALKSDDVEKIIPLFIPETAQKYTELISIAVRTLIRLVDRHIYIGKATLVDVFPAEDQVSQSLQGEKGLVDCFSEGTGALLEVCSIFGQEEFTEIDLDSLDAAGEFLNCVNGLYASAQSRDGSFLELMPPEYEDVTGKAKKTICRVPIYMGDQCLYFTVAELA